jgi:hypothetical protein
MHPTITERRQLWFGRGWDMFMSNFIHLPRKRSSVTWTPSVTLSRVCACVRALVGAHGLMVYHHYSVSDIRTASTPIYFTSSTLLVACLLVNAISNFIWELTPQRGCVPDQSPIHVTTSNEICRRPSDRCNAREPFSIMVHCGRSLTSLATWIQLDRTHN